jgi:crotonobetainyl-CoA:carnitine CoA-transferase CaiB-like acyl-CoA transferase
MPDAIVQSSAVFRALESSLPPRAEPEKTEEWPLQEGGEGLPLHGLRILDLTRILAGPFAAMILSDLGADVIKVERPGAGDNTRRWGPPFVGDDAAYFLSVNRGRRSLTLNLERPEGRAILSRLASRADVLLENFLPEQLERLGLVELRELYPRLAWIAIRAAGTDGPLGAQPGFDAMIQARSGLMSITGVAEPTKVGVAIADLFTGLYAAVAALALTHRKTDEGGPREAEVPLLECAISALVNQASNYLIGDLVPRPMGNEHPNLAPYGTFSCADGQLVVGAGTDRQFAALADVLGLEGLAADPRFVTNSARLAHREELNTAVETALREGTVAVWATRFEEARIPWAPINDLAMVFADPHVQEVRLAESVDSPRGPVRMVRSPLRVDGRRLPIRQAPPELGADTRSILGRLGYSDDEVGTLLEEGVC